MLGKGGSAEVFLAEHMKLHCLRAIKRISKQHLFYGQLINEARILKNLKHPNIPIIYDLEESEGYSYIIEEYIEGQSLKAFRLGQSNVRERTVLEYSIQVCDLIHYLHVTEKPVFYLDLKPDNVLIEGKILKLIDFGTAVFSGEAEKRKASLGTVGYAAPEQYNGNAVDQRSDIYSIGMIMYFLAMGKEFSENQKGHIDSCLMISKRLRDVISKCLRCNPSQRYQTIIQLKNTLFQMYQKNYRNKSISYTSHIIAIAGSQSRIGTTHAVKMVVAMLRKMGNTAEGLTWNSEERYRFADADQDFLSCQVYDMGVLTEVNAAEFRKATFKFLVSGVKGMEWNHTFRCLDILEDDRDVCFLLNFTGGSSYRDAVRILRDRRCLRIPYCTQPELDVQHCELWELMAEQLNIRDKRGWLYQTLNRSAHRRKHQRPINGKTIIGMAGTHNGAGVTHTGIAIAGYCRSILREPTVIIERSGNYDFCRIKNNHINSESPEMETGKISFNWKGITFVPENSEMKIADAVNLNFRYIIIDFGILLSRHRDEFIRCDKKIIVCNCSDWKIDYLEQFIRTWESEPGFSNWHFLSVLSAPDSDNPTFWNPGYIPRPFYPPARAVKIFESIL